MEGMEVKTVVAGKTKEDKTKEDKTKENKKKR